MQAFAHAGRGRGAGLVEFGDAGPVGQGPAGVPPTAGTEALRAELGALVPAVPIASLLVELDRRTGFLDCFSCHHQQQRPPAPPRGSDACPLPRPGLSALRACLNNEG